MYSKKIALVFLSLAALNIGNTNAHFMDARGDKPKVEKVIKKEPVTSETTEKVVGKISFQQLKDFVAGLTIGAMHGLVNRAIEDSYSPKENEVPLFAYICTYLGATQLENAYDGTTTFNRPLIWGRGIGQFIAESVNIIGKNQFKLNPRLNLTLLKAIFTPIKIKYKRK